MLVGVFVIVVVPARSPCSRLEACWCLVVGFQWVVFGHDVVEEARGHGGSDAQG